MVTLQSARMRHIAGMRNYADIVTDPIDIVPHTNRLVLRIQTALQPTVMGRDARWARILVAFDTNGMIF